MLVLGSKTERIPLPLRREWMRARHPGARVVAGWDEIPVDFEDPHVHDLHIELMERLLNSPIDAVFTGEGYGDLLAERWGVEHVCRPRSGLISGTQVRADPAAFWDQLTPPVRAYLCRRVVITGAESTGTTTLAARAGGAPRHGLGAGGRPRRDRGARDRLCLDERRLRDDRPPPAT